MIDWRTSIGLTLGWRIGHGLHWIGSVLHQDKGGIGKSIPDAQEISQDPKDIPRAKPEGNLEGRGKFSRAEGMDFPIPPEFWWGTDILSSSIFLQEVDQEILREKLQLGAGKVCQC